MMEDGGGVVYEVEVMVKSKRHGEASVDIVQRLEET
jgi:hypothetical protein